MNISTTACRCRSPARSRYRRCCTASANTAATIGPDKYEMMRGEYAKLKPAPKFDYVQLGTGIHSYWRPEDGLPLGVCPAVVKIWDEAIMNGWYETGRA